MILNKFFRILLVIMLSLSFGGLWAQDANQNENNEVNVENQDEQGSTESDTLDPTQVEGEGATKIENILISDFEDADRWFGGMSIDYGLIQVEKRRGAVREIRESKPDRSRYVLGAKISFFEKGFSEASIEPPAPIIIPGYTKKISVWAYGHGTKHKLYAIVRDFKGRVFKFNLGELSFNGWKKLEATIPSDPAWPFFSQNDVTRKTFFQTHGVIFLGFFLEFDFRESSGRFYIYLDDLEAESNVYLYEKEKEIASIPEDERLDPINDW